MPEALSQIPGITSNEPTAIVSAIVTAAAKGIRILLTAGAYERLKGVFEKLGVEIKELSGPIPYDSYILIQAKGTVVQIDVYDNSKLINSVRMHISKFEAALNEIIEKQKGDKEDVKVFEVVFSERLRDVISKMVTGEKGND